MTMEKNGFDKLIADCLDGDVTSRELRLTKEEKDSLKDKFPRAAMKRLTKENIDEKDWYLITFHITQEG